MVDCLVSIIMPTRGRTDFVERAVQSVLGQSFQKYELLILDDSPNDLREKVRAIVFGQPRIRLLEIPDTSPDQRRRIGVEASQGEYVTFLDSDDTWSGERLERHLDVWRSNAIGLSWDSWVEIVNGRARPSPQPLSRGPIPPPKAAKLLYLRNFVHCSAGFTKKRLIQHLGGYPTSNLNSDWMLYLKLAERYPTYAIDQTLTFKNLDAPSRLGDIESKRTTRDARLLKRQALATRPSIYWDGFVRDLLVPLSYGRKGAFFRPALDLIKRGLDSRLTVSAYQKDPVAQLHSSIGAL